MTVRNDFWSRRKAAVLAEEEAERSKAEEALAAEREADLADKPDGEILAELGLPDPDELGEGDDFKVFLTETVPARIRTRALRRLWLTNPVLANVDGLVDYGEDFTDASCVIENLQTTYRVGKGMLAHVEEMARQENAKAEGDEDDPLEVAEPEDDITPAPEEPDLNAQDTTMVWVASEAPTEDTETENCTSPRAVSPRRMRFEFEG